jgi:hypothetical protein
MLRRRMNEEQSVEWELARETEVLGENSPHCHSIHQESPCDLACYVIQVAALGSRRLTARAVALRISWSTIFI